MHHFDVRGWKRFGRYLIVGVSTFLFDLALLYVAVTVFSVPYYIAVPCSFFIAVSCNYAISRRYVFRGTERAWHHGYLYFGIAAAIGALITTGLLSFLVATFAMHYVTARVLVACVVGVANYVFNLHLSFNVAGKH